MGRSVLAGLESYVTSCHRLGDVARKLRVSSGGNKDAPVTIANPS